MWNANDIGIQSNIHTHISCKYHNQDPNPQSKHNIQNKFRKIVNVLFKSLLKYQTLNKSILSKWLYKFK